MLAPSAALLLAACTATSDDTDTAPHTDGDERDATSDDDDRGSANSNTDDAEPSAPDDATADDEPTDDDTTPGDETPTLEAGAAVDCNSRLSDDLASAVRALFDIEPEEPISEARMALMTSIKLYDASSIAGIIWSRFGWRMPSNST